MSEAAAQISEDRLAGFTPPNDPSPPMRALRALGRFFVNKTAGAIALVIATIILVLGIIGPWIAPLRQG